MDFIFKIEKGLLFVSDDTSNGVDGKGGAISAYLSMPNIY